jgi:predicted 3-demethylubiquinone-9 3-methyltransferase (glyoxalase superfamily)
MAITRAITPCLWFDDQAEEAAKFYTGIFKNSRIGKISRYGEAGREITHKAPGSVMMVSFELEGQPFAALNGGPEFKFNEAVSFQIACADQDEVDKYWDALGEGGEHGPCGWLKDKFGLSWQVIPKRLPELLEDPDRAKAQRVMEAMLKMGKIEVDELERAAAAA